SGFLVKAKRKSSIPKISSNFDCVRKSLKLKAVILPSGHNLIQLGIVHSLKKRELFLYETKCVRCYQKTDPSVGNCTIECLLYGKPRTTDGITELYYENLVERIKRITKHNLSLILDYPKHAHVLLPNDVINGSVYKQLYANIKCNKLTLMLHADGMSIVRKENIRIPHQIFKS
ncbi:unnamed protein product, partial [Didymodactylos carnosus]